ncbi:MAG: hypothetical protein NTY03_01600 [Candidatus Bathyarchaeota archaeon]|nr:hypothetical protein [Candidatus Bathyarchaeota archaeon]
MKKRPLKRVILRGRSASVDEDKVRLGSAILDTLHELKAPERLEYFLLYAGLENEPLPINVSIIEPLEGLPEINGVQNMFEVFVLDLDGTLYESLIEYEYQYITIIRKIKEKDLAGLIALSSPKDFQKLSYSSVATLHSVITMEGFFDKLVFKLSRRSKPGYDNIWGPYMEKDRQDSLKLRRNA